jgi:integrase
MTMNLTKIIPFSVEKLTTLPVPEKGIMTYRDAQNPLLQLYITPSRKITFFVRKRIKGRDVRLKVGTYPTLTIAQARSHATALAAQVEKGGDPVAEKKLAAAMGITFGEQSAMYIERHCKKRNKTWMKREKEVEKYLQSFLKMPLSSITRDDVENLHLRIGKRAPIMANRIAAFVRSVFNYAIRKGWEGRNPAQGFERFKEVSRDRFILPHEMPFVLKAIEAENAEIIRGYFKMLLLTGARRSDVLQMRWDQIDWNLQTWRIPDSKNGQPLMLPLTQKAIEILKQRKENSKSTWVFPNDRKSERPMVSPQKAWERIRARATIEMWEQEPDFKILVEQIKPDLPMTWQAFEIRLVDALQKHTQFPKFGLGCGLLDVRIHDLRRTFASYQALGGSSLQVIGKSLGHKSIAATQIYARLQLEPVRQSVDKAVDAMFVSHLN